MAPDVFCRERAAQRLAERLPGSPDFGAPGFRRQLELDVERAVARDEPEQVVEHGQAGADVAFARAVERHTDAHVFSLTHPVGGRHPSNQGTAPPLPGRRRTRAFLALRAACMTISPSHFPRLVALIVAA